MNYVCNNVRVCLCVQLPCGEAFGQPHQGYEARGHQTGEC